MQAGRGCGGRTFAAGVDGAFEINHLETFFFFFLFFFVFFFLALCRPRRRPRGGSGDVCLRPPA